MNTKNNKRRQASREKIQQVFLELLQEKNLSQITVSDICQRSGLNRSTFYANYEDIYDLADAIRNKLESDVSIFCFQDLSDHYQNSYLDLFRHIQANQPVYKMYFKLGYDAAHTINLDLLDQGHKLFPEAHLPYHVEFHRAGLTAIIKKWLHGGCQESPETMVQIVTAEYSGRQVL